MESDFSVTKMQETLDLYLVTVLTHLSYMTDKVWADKRQSDYEDKMRKLKGR